MITEIILNKNLILGKWFHLKYNSKYEKWQFYLDESDEEDGEYVLCLFGMLPLDGFDDKSGEDVSGLSHCLLFACLTNEGLKGAWSEPDFKLSIDSTGTDVFCPIFMDFSVKGEIDCKVAFVESIGLRDVCNRAISRESASISMISSSAIIFSLLPLKIWYWKLVLYNTILTFLKICDK